MQRILLVILLGLAIAGCKDRRKEAVEKVDHDAAAIRKASAAVNAVIRNSPDCTVAKPLIPEAYQRIDEALQVVDAPATHETLAALKAQVDRVAELCP
jgi:predicted Fe-Mo cluster-binding NifX family protein